MIIKKNYSILSILAATFVLIFILLSLFFNRYTQEYAIQEARKLAQDSLLTERAIHKYIHTVSRPEIFRLKDEGLLYSDYFSPKTMSFTYAARGIMGFLNEERKKAGLTEVYFKLAASNPRNHLNKADEQERQLLLKMNNKKINYFSDIAQNAKGDKFLYVAIPTQVMTKKCLSCHGDPADAPKEMLKLYPDRSGFYEKEGEIRALISIRVPLKKHMESAKKVSTIFIMSTFFALLIIYLIICYFVLRMAEQQELIIEKSLELEHMAGHDVLTGLPNRRYFRNYAEDKLVQGERSNDQVAFLYIDLDGFKKINDEISHQVGDLVLIAIADCFRTFLRKNELIARIGGDEFCMVIFGYHDKSELEKTAQRLIDKCTQAIDVEGIVIQVGMSIGIASYPDNGKTYDELISMADEAMYRVKKYHKGSYGFVI